MNLLKPVALTLCLSCLGGPLLAQQPATLAQQPATQQPATDLQSPMPSVLEAGGAALSSGDQPAVAPESVSSVITEYLPAVPASLSGQWSGSWLSCTTGHKGPLQASFCQLAPDRYEVTFRGRFFKFIPFRYSLQLCVVGYEADRVLLSGSHKLGPIMGTFSYSAYATASEFVATYRSKQDYGQFRMSRAGW